MRNQLAARRRGGAEARREGSVADDAELPALGEWDGPVYGELGVLATDGTRLECHACGRWYVSLAGHALLAHGLSAAAYRAVFGLKAQTALAGPRLRARRRELADTRLAPYRARVTEVARAQTPEQRAARMRGRALRLEARLALAADPEHARRLTAGAKRAWEQRRERYPETAGAGRPEVVRPFADARAAARRGLAVRRGRLRDPTYRAAVGRRISERKGESPWEMWRLCRLEPHPSTPRRSESMAAALKHPSQTRYPPELRERAVRLVLETIDQTGTRQGAVGRVAHQLGVGIETLRTRVKRAEVDGGRRPGVPTEQQRRLAELEREVRELRRANEILKAAAGFFARELDPRLPR
jgi:transposase